MDEGHVEQPEHEEDRYVGQTEEDHERQAESNVAADAERSIGVVEPEDAGKSEKRAQAAALGGAHRVQEGGGRQQAVAAEERRPLEHDHEESDGVDETEETEKDEAREPVRGHGSTLVQGRAA